LTQNITLRKEDYTENAWEAFQTAQTACRRYNNAQLDVEHLMLGLLRVRNGVAERILKRLKIDTERLAEALEASARAMPRLANPQPGVRQINITGRFQAALINAADERARLKDDLISSDHLLIALVNEDNAELFKLLTEFNINKEKLYAALKDERGGARVSDPKAESKYNLLAQYGTDLTALARAGKLDPVIGRSEEIAQLMQTLTRRSKNNPVLLGDAGVGKTAVVEGLAQRIESNDAPKMLQNKRIITIQLGRLVAGTSLHGQFEERLRRIMDEFRYSRGALLWFLDEIHTMVGAGPVGGGGSLDVSNIMKPALARGELQIIGATTLTEYRKYIESDAALERRFTPVMVEEPSPEVAEEMLLTLRPRYEKHHGLRITDAAVKAAVSLSTRYITDRFLPDKAIDMIDQAASRRRIQSESKPAELRDYDDRIKALQDEILAAQNMEDYEKAANLKAEQEQLTDESSELREAWKSKTASDGELTADDVAAIIALRTGIPAERLAEDEIVRLKRLGERLHERIVGQDDAVAAVANAIKRARTDLRDRSRPIGSFIFVGPTGVGKTELAKALTEYLFDTEDSLIRVDMSEYSERYSITRLIGSPPGYIDHEEGGQLTEAVRRRPFSVVLFDEIEKAHREIFPLLLQVLDEGHLTDAHGRKVNFKNTIVIMTSNTGTSDVSTGTLGFRAADAKIDREAAQNTYNAALKKELAPEFLNRIDEIVVFDQLSKAEIFQIFDKLIDQLRTRLAERKLKIDIADEAREWLVERGYDLIYGARPLRRVIQRHLETKIADMVLEDQAPENSVLHVAVENDELKIAVK